MKRRLLSTLLALCMVLALLPGTALAAMPSTASLKPGETRTFTADSGYKDYSWWSDNPSIVSVTKNANQYSATVTAKSEGTTVIHVQYSVPGTTSGVVNGKPGIVDADNPEEYKCTVVVSKESGDSSSTGTTVTGHQPDGKAGDSVAGSVTDIGEFGGGLVPVKRGDLWGYADQNMRLVIPFQFDGATRFNDGGIAAVKVDKTWYVVNKQLKSIFTALLEGYASSSVSIHDTYFGVHRVASSGRSNKYYTLEGELSTLEATTLKEVAYRKNRGDLYYWKPDGTLQNWEWVGSSNWLFLPPFTELYSSYRPSDKDVKLKVPIIKNVESPDSGYIEDICVVRSESGKYGAMDKTGKLVIQCQYDFLSNSSGGYLSYKKGTQCGVLKNPAKSGGTTTPVVSSYTITLDPNGGKVSPASLTVDKGAKYYSSLPTPTKSGYDFDGWYTSKSGGTKITSSTTATKSTTLYAHWTEKEEDTTLAVKFNANGGTVFLRYKSALRGARYRDLPAPTRNKYHFQGWYYNSSGTGTKVTSTTRVTKTSDHTLYAKWSTTAPKVQSRKSGSWTVYIPPYYKLPLYASETTAVQSKVTPAKSSEYTVKCTKMVTLNNGTVRYYGTVNGVKRWFQFTCEMDIA